MEKEKYLPLGTVILLKNATKPMMIIGYKTAPNSKEVYKNGKVVEGKTCYDYCGCICPEGVINSLFMCMFDHDQIDKILFTGFESEDYKKYNEKLINNTELEEFKNLKNKTEEKKETTE